LEASDMSNRFRFVLGLAAALALVAPSSAPKAQGRRLVRIAAASDVRFALDEVTARLRETQPDLDVRVTYGSSGTFFSQIVNGAPFDLFLSADVDYARQLTARGLTVEGSEFVYGVGQLVVWVPSTSMLDVEQSGMLILLDSHVEHIAIANPATAPYGRAAEAAMRGIGVYGRVADKLVLGETVAQAFQFVQSGSAEVGVVALSLALAPTLSDAGRYWVVPRPAYPRMEQGGVILRAAADVAAARQVRTFLLGDTARGVLRRYGFSFSN
jgi:molybdate transport system substrate-binding protein